MANTKKQSKLAWIAVCAIVVGLILYLVSSLIFPSKSILGWQVIAAGLVSCFLLAVVPISGRSDGFTVHNSRAAWVMRPWWPPPVRPCPSCSETSASWAAACA